MRSSGVTQMVRDGLLEAGVPEHVFGIEVQPPRIHVKVLIGGRLVELSMRSTATTTEVEQKLAQLTIKWQLHQQGQKDFEG